MSGQACARSRESSSLSTEGPPAKKRAVCRRIVEKWVVENDRALNTSVWLKFDMTDRDHVASLRCEVCSQFKDKLVSMRNFRPAFIDGTTNVRTTTFKEHAATDMHARAMVLYSMPVVCASTRRSWRLYYNRQWTMRLESERYSLYDSEGESAVHEDESCVWAGGAARR